MLIYIFLWFFLFALSFLRTNDKIVLWIVSFFLILLAGLRDITIGTDTPAYYDIFNYIAQEDATYIEPGWYFLNRLVALLGGDFTSLLLLVSAITLIPVLLVINRHSEYKLCSLFLYYSMYMYLNTWNGMRQYLAVSIGLLSFSYLCSSKRGKFFLCVIIACLFHYSAILLLLAYWICNRNINNTSLFILLLLSFGLGLCMNNDLYALITGKYAHYLESEQFGYRTNISSAIILTLIMNFVVLIIVLTSKIKNYQGWFNVYLLGIITLNLTFRLALGGRLILFFTIVQIIIFPYYLRTTLIKPKIYAFLWVLVYFALLFYRNIFDGMGGGGIIPYKFIF